MKEKKSKKEITSSSVFSKSKDIFSRIGTDGSVVIISLEDDEKFYSLSHIAADLWQLIDGKKSLDKIESLLLEKHNISKSYFKKNASKVLADLAKHNLIRL